MKLRQKLAVVLASAMVVTAVPVVTMAASTTTVSRVVTVATDKKLTEGEAPVLAIKLKNGFTTTQNFYLTLENAKWEDKEKTPAFDITAKGGRVVGQVQPTGEKEATVSFKSDAVVKEDDTLYISLAGITVTGEAKISVDGEGTEIDNVTLTFANKTDTKAAVTVKDATTFYTTTAKGEKVGTIVLSEVAPGQLGSQKITIELEHSDFEFVNNTTDKLTVKGTKGLSGTNEVYDYVEKEADLAPGKFTFDSEQETITLILPAKTSTQKGTFEISNVTVKSTNKTPDTGNFEVTVGGDKINNTKVKVATVAEYGTELTVAEKKEITAGKDAKVKITYKETVKGSVGKSDVDFVLNQGYIEKASVDALNATPIYKDKDAEKEKDAKKIIGFTITTPNSDTELKKFIDGKEITIRTELDMTGEIILSTSGRYVEEQKVVVAEAKPNFTVKAEAMTLKVGQSKQVGGKFVITEDKAGALDKSSVITLELPTEKGISFTELPKVTVDGAKAKVEWKDKTSKSAINVTLTKTSKETPATITVEGLEVTVDRTVAQGSYDLELLVNGYEGTLKAKDFFVVGTPNTEELAANGLPKGTATFTINSAEYTVNGKVATMDARAYIQDPGYTMVPVRYVATAFGVNAQDILFSNGTATIFAGTRTIQLTAGSDVAIVNGASIKLATKVVVKDGRTYAPVGEIARILGVSANWDATNKVATFENK